MNKSNRKGDNMKVELFSNFIHSPTVIPALTRPQMCNQVVPQLVMQGWVSEVIKILQELRKIRTLIVERSNEIRRSTGILIV
jgi:hypothetical protein